MGSGKSGPQMAADNLARFHGWIGIGSTPRTGPTTGAETSSAGPI
jgi:hypothetical protein